jgi:hypothetical protein
MEDDILHRYICDNCKTTVLGFDTPTFECVICNSPTWRRFDTASTVAMTAGLLGAQYDSVDTINEDVDAYTAQDQLEKDWKQIDEARRQ